MRTGHSISSLQSALRTARQAMFALGIAVFVGIVGQVAAIWLAGPAADPATATLTRVEPRQAGLRVPQHSGFAAAARRFEAVYGGREEPADRQ
ncbi:MAG: hypothetical protein GC202_05565 [Alphaproteobacteria bacterium]|nr:hypothetical protein [Alphaproteobacteria bacterium]